MGMPMPYRRTFYVFRVLDKSSWAAKDETLDSAPIPTGLTSMGFECPETIDNPHLLQTWYLQIRLLAKIYL